MIILNTDNNNIYIVKANDNLYEIAKANNTTIGILKALNNLNSNILQIGQILKLPTIKAEESIPGDYIIYTVKKGDNLYSIASNYNISLEDLINFNEKGSTILHIGDELLIPKKQQTENIVYIVKPRDTLYNIAKRYNLSVDTLKELNNLDNNMLKIGSELIIPGTKNYQTYVVRTRDSLASIANMFNTTIDDIKRINNLKTDEVLVGQVILIP